MSFAKNIDKNISKNLSGKYSQKLLDNAKQFTTDALRTTSKIVKQWEQLVILLVIKLLIELGKCQKLYHKIIQTQLQMNMIMKYLNKDMYLQKKERKLLMN